MPAFFKGLLEDFIIPAAGLGVNLMALRDELLRKKQIEESNWAVYNGGKVVVRFDVMEIILMR